MSDFLNQKKIITHPRTINQKSLRMPLKVDILGNILENIRQHLRDMIGNPKIWQHKGMNGKYI